MTEIKIVSCRTINSEYSHNCIEVRDDKDNFYKMRAEELLKLIKGAKFKATKARIHTYLEVVEEETLECKNCKKQYTDSDAKEFEDYCCGTCEGEYREEYAGEISGAKEDEEIDRQIDEMKLEAKR